MRNFLFSVRRVQEKEERKNKKRSGEERCEMEDETRKTIYGERNKGVEEGRGIRGWKKEEG